jgi:phage/plasmid primase-like uncharacterized protein
MSEEPSLADLVPSLTRASREELHGPCPFCGGSDRFVVFGNGRGWCRQCNWKGDSIQLLRDRDGLSFREAKRRLGLDSSVPSRQAQKLATVHSFALATAKQAYHDWQRQQLMEITDQLRLLSDELAVAEIAYRAIHRRPDLYSETEQSFWVQTLASLYDRHGALEHHLEVALDVLTYDKHQAARFAWWQQEGESCGSGVQSR